MSLFSAVLTLIAIATILTITAGIYLYEFGFTRVSFSDFFQDGLFNHQRTLFFGFLVLMVIAMLMILGILYNRSPLTCSAQVERYIESDIPALRALGVDPRCRDELEAAMSKK